MTGLLVLAAFSVVAGIGVAARTLYRARGVPRTALHFVSLASALFCISVGVTLLYAGWRAKAAGGDSLRGQPLPEFHYKLEDGEHSTAEWRGKPVLLNLWATWCEPCREELRTLSRLQTDVQVLALSSEDSKLVLRFLSGGAYPGLRAGYITDGAPQLPVRPVTIAISRDGLVREAKIGALESGDLEAMLASIR